MKSVLIFALALGLSFFWVIPSMANPGLVRRIEIGQCLIALAPKESIGGRIVAVVPNEGASLEETIKHLAVPWRIRYEAWQAVIPDAMKSPQGQDLFLAAHGLSFRGGKGVVQLPNHSLTPEGEKAVSAVRKLISLRLKMRQFLSGTFLSDIYDELNNAGFEYQTGVWQKPKSTSPAP